MADSSWLETYGLVHEALVFPRVFVHEVQGVAGELDAARHLALAEESISAIWEVVSISQGLLWSRPVHTADLPNNIGGDIFGRHFGEDVGCIYPLSLGCILRQLVVRSIG